jgi:hypothetical protein
MAIMFNTILREAGLTPSDVRLLRHKDKRATKGRTPYELWRDNRRQFENYQSGQSIENRNKFAAPYWASFVVNFDDETMFVGIYAVKGRQVLERDRPKPHIEGGIDKAGSCDIYHLALDNALRDLIGRLFIDWGEGALAGFNTQTETTSP